MRLANLILLLLTFSSCCGQEKSIKTPVGVRLTEKKLYGYAAQSYKIKKVLFADKLDNPSTFQHDWVVQQSQADSALKRYAKIENGKLEVHDPRGCTIWYKNKLSGNIMISYRINVPDHYNQGNDIVPRDINQFWMATTPEPLDVYAKGGLFDFNTYNGDFKSYDDIHSFYASTGGGNTTNYNRTTRMRRYPRSVDGKQVNHLGLNNRDDDSSFLIVANKEHLIQLVAAGDIIQYIFDGRVVYEIKKNDSIDILNDASKNMVSKAVWGEKPWLTYTEGYFGFRMTRTHHTYSDFKVFELTEK